MKNELDPKSSRRWKKQIIINDPLSKTRRNVVKGRVGRVMHLMGVIAKFAASNDRVQLVSYIDAPT
jgi:hypothetical protein